MKNKIWKNFIDTKSKKNKNKLNRKNLYIFPNFRGFQIAALIFFALQFQYFIKIILDYYYQ